MNKVLETFGFCKAKLIGTEKWIEGYIFRQDPPVNCLGPVPDQSPTWYIVRSEMTDWGLPQTARFYEIDPDTVCPFTGYYDQSDKKNKLFDADTVTFQMEEGAPARKGTIAMFNDRWCILVSTPGAAAALPLKSVDTLPIGLTVTGNIL